MEVSQTLNQWKLWKSIFTTADTWRLTLSRLDYCWRALILSVSANLSQASQQLRGSGSSSTPTQIKILLRWIFFSSFSLASITVFIVQDFSRLDREDGRGWILWSDRGFVAGENHSGLDLLEQAEVAVRQSLRFREKFRLRAGQKYSSSIKKVSYI